MPVPSRRCGAEGLAASIGHVGLVSPVDQRDVAAPPTVTLDDKVGRPSVEEIGGSAASKAVARVLRAVQAELRDTGLQSATQKVGGDRLGPIKSQ